MEADLIERLRRGDERAFDRVFDAYRTRLFRFLVRLSGHPALAEDLLQETFLRLARHAPALAPDTRLEAWLFTVARNLYRSHRRWALLDLERLSELRLWSRLAPAAPSPLAQAAVDQQLGALEQALATLPLAHREILLLVAIDGMTPAEAATVLEITGEAARQRLARARGMLRELLSDEETDR